MRNGLLNGLVALLLLTAPGLADPARMAERQFSPADLKADIAAMYAGLLSAHYDLYAFTPKAELDSAYKKMLAGIDRPMTEFEARLYFEEFAALVKMGHTRVDFDFAAWTKFMSGGGKVFPFALRIDSGRAYIVANKSGLDTVAPGDEIVMLDGKPMRAWLARVERRVSAETPDMADSLMGSRFARYLWAERGQTDGFDLELRSANGKTHALRVPARTAEEMGRFQATQPPALSLDEPERDAKILDGKVGYLRPGPFYNTTAKTGADEWDTSGFVAFIDGAFRKFNAAGAEWLIIDLRGNPGGANIFSDPLVAWFAGKPFHFASQFKIKVSPESTKVNADRLKNDAAAAGEVSRQYAELYAKAKDGDIVDYEVPLVQPRRDERFKGKVYILIDRESYSNSVATAALIQDYGFAKIVGEPTSDMATGYGAMETFTLPKTGIAVCYPKAFFVRPSGDTRVRGVTPDIAIRFPVVQTPADEVLMQAVAIALKNR